MNLRWKSSKRIGFPTSLPSGTLQNASMNEQIRSPSDLVGAGNQIIIDRSAVRLDPFRHAAPLRNIPGFPALRARV